MRTVMIMAGGRSQRMRASGCPVHKALRRVGDRTIIECNLIDVCEHGFKDVWVSANAEELELLAWLAGPAQRIAGSMGAKLQTVVEQTPLGTIGAVGLLTTDLADVLVLNVDNLTDLDLSDFFAQHLESKAAMTIATHEQHFQIPFGEVTSNNGYLTGYLEKPLLPVTVSSGVYVLSRRAMAVIPAGTRMQIPELVNRLRADGETIFCYQHSAVWIDVNDEQALAIANEKFSLRGVGAK